MELVLHTQIIIIAFNYLGHYSNECKAEWVNTSVPPSNKAETGLKKQEQSECTMLIEQNDVQELVQYETVRNHNSQSGYESDSTSRASVGEQVNMGTQEDHMVLSNDLQIAQVLQAQVYLFSRHISILITSQVLLG